ncbi:MAG: hypothetical protein SGILL_009571 [Bacillariaceae sp.]
MTNKTIDSSGDDSDCTLPVIRRLTRPLITPPKENELKDVLMDPWPIRVAVSPTDYTTLNHWKKQPHTALFLSMLEWPSSDDEPDDNKGDTKEQQRPTAHLHPFFSFGDPSSPFFFNPVQDIGNCLRNLLFHQVASHQSLGHDITLSSHETDLFVATGHVFQESEIASLRISSHFYLLRCHHDKQNQTLVFGYHVQKKADEPPSAFQKLEVVSLQDNNWRLTTSIILKNLARILLCLKDFAIPLVSRPEKLTLLPARATPPTQPARIQKVYDSDYICNIFNATVENMIRIYGIISEAGVPHTDQIVSVQDVDATSADTIPQQHRRSVQFAPVGRSYLPENFDELMDALICVGETLVALGHLGIMHRDIRWANIFHALESDGGDCFTNEWVLFDFEYAAMVPQEAFPAHTLTPDNHAPEMILDDNQLNDTTANTTSESAAPHDTAVDIWGLGYLIQHAEVDVPESHSDDMAQLRKECMQANPNDRPSAEECLSRLRALHERPTSVTI